MPTSTWFRLPEARRAAVLAAAEAEFGTRGFSRGSLNVIAKQAQVSKGSLFQYFADKSDLCVYLADLVCQRIRAAMVARIADLPWTSDFFAALHRTCLLWMAYYAGHPAELAFTTAVNLEQDPTTQRLVRAAVNRHYLDVFRPLLVDARDAGQLSEDADLDAFLALLMLLLPHLAIAPSYPGLDAVLGLAGPRADGAERAADPATGSDRAPGSGTDTGLGKAAEEAVTRLVNALRNGFAPR